MTQLCEKDGVYYKSQNYIERKILVSQPTPYKLLINDADYDIIKNFKTGWNLRNQEPLQTTDDNLLGSDNFKPFDGIGKFSDIKGWLEISNINENYAWGEEPETESRCPKALPRSRETRTTPPQDAPKPVVL